MKEEAKAAGLKKLDNEIELLSDYRKQLETGTTLPDKDSLKKYCDYVARLFKNDFSNEQMAKVLKESGLQSGATLRSFIERMRSTIGAQESVRGPERAAALDENQRKDEEVHGQIGAIRTDQAPLTKAKKALEDLNRGY